jgi:predicted ArsR family transcriptional regulator
MVASMDRRSVTAIAALDDEVRRALYDVASAGPITREQAARAVGISRNLAAFHLDKLVDVGLLEAATAPPQSGRVGRAPKCYRRAAEPVAVSVPPRQPALLAEILATAVVTERRDERARQAVDRVARQRGREVGAAEQERVRPGRLGVERALRITADLLAGEGFEPEQDNDVVRLRNCPFHPLAATEPELVCGLNHAYLAGVIDGLGAAPCVEAVLAPHAGRCCVEMRRR